MLGTCEQCPRPVRVGGRGRPQRFCSDACRMRAARSRRLPDELTGRARWVRWRLVERGGRLTKLPVQTTGRAASSTDPRTWTSFERASASTAGDGLGFVLGDGVGCIDLDHVLDGRGRASAAARRVIGSLPVTYAEVSPSGDGLHLWFLMAEAPGTVRTVDGVSVETYSVGRYMTVTGRRWGTAAALARLR